MKLRDLVEITEGRRTIAGLIVRASTDPNRHCLVLEETGEVYARIPPACRQLGVLIDGRQYLDHDQAALHGRLLTLASTPYGRQKIDHARLTLARNTGARRERVIPPPRGKRVAYDPPIVAVDVDKRRHTVPMERFLAVRDPGAAPSDLGPDGREVRALDALKATSPRAYHAYVGMVLQGQPAAEVAALLGTSVGSVYVAKHRAEKFLRDTADRAAARV